MPAAALCKGPKIFARDFPERGKPVACRRIGGMRTRRKTRNVSSQKHEFRPGRLFIPENAVFTRIAEQSKYRLSVRGLHHAIFSSTMHSPDNAVSERIDPQARQHETAATDHAASTTDGASCTQPIVERAIAQYAVLNG
ncbi:hypothetical protein HT746_32440 [Burkholderia pyrrocinia]|uniref:hypothetical protein n=1 Tax=Burkholderia pyrrocinia TaxID=60550 RepID=UPI001576EC1A|nr:hypothetical protein [Burkholderia pyrrocinia]NTX31766.1 hypothetical protein [Burkholderia pyrrocinia]